MDVEKRADTEQEPAPKGAEIRGKKPVVIYILILFIAAFLLMALSFFMHQRANTEALGDLKDSVAAMQDTQVIREENLFLREELEKMQTESEARQEELGGQLADALGELDTWRRHTKALESLNQLQQFYDANDLEACKKLISDFQAGLADFLPGETAEGLISPLEQYEAIKAAVEKAA